MAYAEPFLRLVAIGTIYEVESFSFSMSLVSRVTPGPTPSAPTEVPQGIIDAVADMFASPGAISQGAVLTTVKLNLIGTNGRYANEETVLHDYDPGVPGASTQYPPAQVAYAVSLGTAKSRGRAHAGRFYLPLPAQLPNVDGWLDDVARSAIVDPVYDMLAAINDTMVDWRVGVTSDLGAGAQEFVTHMRSGRVLDTIRSRRDKIPEDYVTSSPIPA